MEDNERSCPLVSVCCTTYNLEKYVSKMIQSILDQDTTFNFELIVHDDASTDDTQHIINSFYEKYPNKIKRAFQETNLYTSHEGGLGYMFNNYILPEAEGKYIAICDGDDYWTDTHKLQKQVDFLELNEDYSACVTNALVLNEITNEKREYYTDKKSGLLTEKQIVTRGGAVYPTSTLMFRKEKFISSMFYKQYDDFSKYHEYDTLFIYCLLFTGKIGYLEDCTAVYRRWDGGLFSGIMYDSDKTSEMKEKEMTGNKKLVNMVDTNRKKLFKRKISLDSLSVLRNKTGIKKYRYVTNLHAKELIKFLTGTKRKSKKNIQ